MKHDEIQDCDCRGSRRRRKLIRLALLLAGLSLAAYIPYKYATQPHVMKGLYAFLFPLSGILVLAAVAFALKPTLAGRLPIPLRGGLAALSVTWLWTGLQCIPHFAERTMTTPLSGLFAFFHMFVQHVFLSLAVIAFVVVPQALARRLETEEEGAEEQAIAVSDAPG